MDNAEALSEEFKENNTMPPEERKTMNNATARQTKVAVNAHDYLQRLKKKRNERNELNQINRERRSWRVPNEFITSN